MRHRSPRSTLAVLSHRPSLPGGARRLVRESRKRPVVTATVSVLAVVGASTATAVLIDGEPGGAAFAGDGIRDGRSASRGGVRVALSPMASTSASTSASVSGQAEAGLRGRAHPAPGAGTGGATQESATAATDPSPSSVSPGQPSAHSAPAQATASGGGVPTPRIGESATSSPSGPSGAGTPTPTTPEPDATPSESTVPTTGAPTTGAPSTTVPTTAGPDTTPPDTTELVATGTGPVWTFTFGADEPATFTCTIDGQSLGLCSSGLTLADLAPGEHHMHVVATDLAGNRETSPAGTSWSVPGLLDD